MSEINFWIKNNKYLFTAKCIKLQIEMKVIKICFNNKNNFNSLN